MFDEIVKYFINSQITSQVSVSALAKIIPLILNLKAERKRDASYCIFTPVICSSAQQ